CDAKARRDQATRNAAIRDTGLMLLPSTRCSSRQSTLKRRDVRRATTYGTRKILSVQGSFTLVPDGKPLTSAQRPSLSNGLRTDPGLPGTNFPVGNVVEGAEAGEDETLVCDCVVSLRDVAEVPLDLRLWPRSASIRGSCCGADATSGGTDWPGFVTSDAVSVPTMVDDPWLLLPVASYTGAGATRYEPTATARDPL